MPATSLWRAPRVLGLWRDRDHVRYRPARVDHDGPQQPAGRRRRAGPGGMWPRCHWRREHSSCHRFGSASPGPGSLARRTHVRQLQFPPDNARHCEHHGRLPPVTPGHLGRRRRLIPVSALNLHSQLETSNSFPEFDGMLMAANRAFLTSHAPARGRIGTPSARAEASAHARSRPACSSRHAARQTRASTRRSRLAVSICSLIGGPAQRAGSPARAASGLSARGSGTALPAPSACLPRIRGVSALPGSRGAP